MSIPITLSIISFVLTFGAMRLMFSLIGFAIVSGANAPKEGLEE